MKNEQQFTPAMIQGNHISNTSKAEITINDTTVTIHTFNGSNKFDVWVQTPRTANRMTQDVSIDMAVIVANDLLKRI